MRVSLDIELESERGGDLFLLCDLQEEKIEPFDLPELIFGAAAWSSLYTKESNLSTDVPLRTIRLALR